MPRPTSLRGTIKAAETQLVLGRTRGGAVPGVVLRIFSVFGPWEHPHRLVPTALRAALRDQALPLTAPGLGRDFVYVADVADACLRAAVSAGVEGEIFNVGGGRHVTNEQVVAAIERVTARTIRSHVGVYEAHATDGQVDRAEISKTCQLLGWRPRDLVSGLRDTLDWLRTAQGAGG